MSALGSILSRESASQCVDLVRRFPWIAEADVPAPEGNAVFVMDLVDGQPGNFREVWPGAGPRDWTHWFPAPRQPAGSDIIDDIEKPYWPEPGQSEADRICELSSEAFRAACKEGDFVSMGACALALHQLATDPRGPQQIGKQRALAIRLRLLVKWQDRTRLRRRLQAEGGKS